MTGRIDRAEALALTSVEGAALDALTRRARAVAVAGHGAVIGYSRKVFVPLTRLCRDVCHYCTFAQSPRQVADIYLSADAAVALCREGAALGCKEALLTLGDRPEARYRVAADWLEGRGFTSTIDYIAHVAERIVTETGLLPHVNAGVLSQADYERLRRWSPSMGIMLESAAARLCSPGGAHHGSPDKRPAVRLASVEAAGRAGIALTSGILIGIGETRAERIDALLALRDLHDGYGHLQEVIVQNFRAKPGTRMAHAAEPSLEDLRWTIAIARLLFGQAMTLQAPPNLSPGDLGALIASGINDWGGVSPLTPDHVNPEAPWPHVDRLEHETQAAGGVLQERLTLHPAYVRDAGRWIDPHVAGRVMALADAQGFARQDRWMTGAAEPPPGHDLSHIRRSPHGGSVERNVSMALDRAWAGLALDEEAITDLFAARGASFTAICRTADARRRTRVGDTVSYVVNRNINYTNICAYRCGFCAFSKAKAGEMRRDKPYRMDLAEIGA